MDMILLEFISILRKNGIRVSLSESLDALAAMGHVSIENKSVFRDALRATLIKDTMDVPAFDELFTLFFSGVQAIFPLESVLGPLVSMGRMSPDTLKKLASFMDQMSGTLSPLTKYLLQGDSSLLDKILQAAAAAGGMSRMENHLQINFFAQAMMARLPWDEVARDMEALEKALRDAGAGDEDIRELVMEMNKRKQSLRDALREYTEREFRKRNFGYAERSRDNWLSHRNLASMSDAEIREMKNVVQRLALRIKNVAVIRRKTDRRGLVDVRQTLRRNLRHDGIPFGLVKRKKREDKPRLVLLCDISDSMRNISRFMLQFIHTVQELFSRVRSFAFVSSLGEMTDLFKKYDVDRAVDMAYRGEVVEVFSHSNYGRALSIFHREYLHAITSRTTVVIMGDARNNYNDPCAWALRQMRDRAREVIWLNPEHPSAWGFGDSIMDIYAPFCDVVEEVRTLAQLRSVIDSLVAGGRGRGHSRHRRTRDAAAPRFW